MTFVAIVAITLGLKIEEVVGAAEEEAWGEKVEERGEVKAAGVVSCSRLVCMGLAALSLSFFHFSPPLQCSWQPLGKQQLVGSPPL